MLARIDNIELFYTTLGAGRQSSGSHRSRRNRIYFGGIEETGNVEGKKQICRGIAQDDA